MMKTKQGSILIEALLAVVVLSMVVLSVVPMLSFLLRRTSQSRFASEAGLLMQEGMEVTYNVLISNWDSYPNDDTYHPGKSSGKWALFQNPETNLETIFTRSVEIKKACRVNGEVVDEPTCSGILDPDSKMVTTTVSWLEDGDEKKVSSKLMMVNMKAN